MLDFHEHVSWANCGKDLKIDQPRHGLKYEECYDIAKHYLLVVVGSSVDKSSYRLNFVY